MIARRTLARGLAAALLALPAWPGGALAQERVLRVVSPWEFTSPEPADTGFVLARLGVAETLVQVEPDGRLVGGVAESWNVAEDRLTWRFKLREGARFHDGAPVTAEAVAGSLRRAFVGESLSSVPLDAIESGAGEVVIRTRTPFGVLPAFLADYASVVLAPTSYGPDGKVARIVGTGPYRLAAASRTALDLEGFDAHPRGAPAIARVRYEAVPNGETRANIAMAGDADLVFTLAPSGVARVNAARGMRVESLVIPRVRPIAFNAGLPQFADPRVRRAVSMSIDRAAIASAILRHPPSAATQLLPPMLTGWHDPSLPPLTFDPEGAMRLLDEAGWRPGADGVRVKDGVRLAATMLTPSNRPELPVMATAIQAQLKRVGVEVAVQAGPPGEVPAANRDGTTQMSLIARTYVNVPEVIATILPDFTRERSVWSTLNWPGRERVRPLAEEYVASFDEARKAELRRAIVRIIHEELPVVPVAWFEHAVAVSDRVKGVVIDPYELRYLLDRVAWR